MTTATFANGTTSFTPGVSPFSNGLAPQQVGVHQGTCCLIWDCYGSCYVCTPNGQCCPVAACSTGQLGVNAGSTIPFGGVSGLGMQNLGISTPGISPINWQGQYGSPFVGQGLNSYAGIPGCSPFGVTAPIVNGGLPFAGATPWSSPYNCGPIGCAPFMSPINCGLPYGCSPYNCLPGYGVPNFGMPFGGMPFGGVPFGGSPFFGQPGQPGNVQGDQQLRNNG